MRWKLCGVSPMWAMTGMSTRVTAAMVSAMGTPPSSFTIDTPPSLTMRTADSRATSHALLVGAERQVADHERP